MKQPSIMIALTLFVTIFFAPREIYAESLDIPIDQYYQFSSNDPQTIHPNVYVTGKWNDTNNYVLFKVSDMTPYNTILQHAVINYYQLKISDPADSTGSDYLTEVAIWYNCNHPTEYTYHDIPTCGIYRQSAFAVTKTGTTIKQFDYAPKDAFTHWLLFTGQNSGLKIDPQKLWWHIDYTPPSPTPTPTPKPGDANNDAQVNEADYEIFVAHYKQAGLGFSHGDFNQDGVVDGVDFAIWVTHYGT